jgi:lipopolysaccharide transport system permease protein
MAAWGYFARVAQSASGAFLEFYDVIEKVYFPRIFIPISKVIVQLIDYAVAFLVLFVLMLIYDIPFIFNLIYLPFVVLVTILLASAVAVWISALVARYRDLQQVVSFVLQVAFYFTPVLYPIKVIPEILQPFYWLNPMAIIVGLHRWCIWGETVPLLQLFIVIIFSIFMLITGVFYAHKVEAIMADIL